jgi:hypothetical protein
VDKLSSNTIGIYAALSYDIIAAVNSSPQTTEINAKARAETLMKWVHLGLAQVALFVVIGAYVGDDTWSPLVGGGVAAGLLYAQYVHAKKAGLESIEPGTETY